MKKISITILLSLLLIAICGGCTTNDGGDGDITTPPTPETSNPLELEEGLTLADEQVSSTASGHGDFNVSESTNIRRKFRFYLPDTGKNNAYVSADFTNWNTEGSSNYLLTYVPATSSKVFSNLYEVELTVPKGDIELRVYLLDTDTPNFTFETFKLREAEVFENNIITNTSYSFENKINYRHDGVLVEAPFTVYNKQNELVTTFKDPTNTSNVKTIESFDNWSMAIHYAAGNSTSQNILTVVDANGLPIFARTSKTYSHVFDGDYYVGHALKAECEAWVFNSAKGYVIDGQGVAYINTGKVDYDNSGYNDISSHREMESGGYNYMFTTDGYANGLESGFTYMSMDIDFSEAEYLPTKNTGDVWNAYLFINPALRYYDGDKPMTLHADLGLIGMLNGNEVVWKLVRNSTYPGYNGGVGDKAKFYVFPEVVTTMTWDGEKQAYSNADDLRFECYVHQNGFVLNITNLTTGKVSTINEVYPNAVPDDKEKENTSYGRMLLGISYCPVRANVWDTRNGGVFRNVIVFNSEVGTYQKDGDYDQVTKYPFHAGTETMFNGFTQAPDVAGYRLGKFLNSGSIGMGSSAINYKQNDIYTVYDIDYRGM